MNGSRLLRLFKTLSLVLCLFAVSACSGSKEEAANKYLNNGIALYEEEKLAKASVELRNALQIDPKLASAYFYLALIAEKEQNWKSLFKNLTKVEQLDSSRADARVKLGYLLLMAKQFDVAIEKADAVLVLEPDSPDAYLIKASAFLGKELFDVAQTYVTKAIEFHADPVEAASLRASILHRQGYSDQALSILAEVIDQQTDNLHLLLLRAEVNEERNDFAAMEADYRTLIKDYPEERAFYFKLVSLLRDSGRVVEAQANLEAYLRRYPEDAEVRMALVQLVSTNNEQRADKLLDSYIDAQPDNAELRFYRIDRLLSRDLEQQALAELKFISESGFDNQHGFRALSMQAEIILSAGQPDQALAIVNQVLDLDSHFEDALLCRARYYLITEDVDAAVTDLRVILRNNPASERALVMLANAYVTSGSQQLADDTFRQVLDINPGNIQAAVPVIKGLLEKQDSDRSEQIIENALAHSPNNEILLSILAQIKLANQDIEGGQKVISKIHASGENPAFGHYLSGRAQQSQARYKQAIASYKKALAMNPDLTRALENLAHCYGRLNQQETLLDFLKSFSKEHSNNLSAFSIMAAVQRQREDYTAAIATLEQGLQRNQHWVGGYSALAVNQVSMGDQDSAIDTYKRGLAVVPNSNLLKMLLASLYENVQAFADAKALYESVLLTNPDHHAVINNLASLLTDQFESKDNISRAVALTERFADSDQPFFIDTYAWALVKSGLPQVAEPLFAKATKLAPNIAIFHYHRAIGFKRLGRIEEAKEALKSAQANVSAQDPLRRVIETELTGL